MHAKRTKRSQAFLAIDVYPVTCQALSAGRSDDDVLHAIIEGGARIVQLRDKTAGKRELFEKARRFREVTQAADVLLIVNDHVDIAQAVDADGVHLGQDDLALAAARDLLPDMLIGVSTHSLKEASIAQSGGADYVNIGPIFSTQTKTGISEYLGVGAIDEIAPTLSIPFTVMGGIKLDNIDSVLAAGVRRIAVVTAITAASDMVAATREFRRRIREGIGND